jgi:WD40 repeat protein
MAERVEGLSQLERDSTQSRPGQRKRHEKPPNFVLIAALVIAAIMTLFGLVGLQGYQGAREQAAAVSQALGQANARALTAFALYETGQRDDPSGSLALLLAREAVLFFLDNDLPLDPEADAALRKAVDAAPPWHTTLSERDHAASVLAATFSPDGRYIVTTNDDGAVRFWQIAANALGDTQAGQPIATLEGHTDVVASVAFSPDGRYILTAGNDDTARVWHFPKGLSFAGDTPTGHLLNSLQGHKDWVSSAAFSPDGQRIVTASWDNTARVWDAEKGQQLLALEGHERNVLSAVYSPDGQFIVTASDDSTARIWDAQTGQHLHTLEGHRDSVNTAVFSLDGQYILTASDDGTARTWDAYTGQPLRSLEGHLDSVWSAAYSPDDKHVATASADLTARVWVAQIDGLLDLAGSLIQREPPTLTPAERGRFLGE